MATPLGSLDQPAHQFIAQTLGTPQFEIAPLAGDASSRRYSRITKNGDSYVLMVWEAFADDGHYPFLNVRNHFAKHGVQVPQVIAKAPKLGLVLLEDLGDLTLERKFWENQNQVLALPHYKQAVDELIKIHYLATNDSDAECVAFDVAFDTEKLLWEMNYGREHLLEKLCKVQLPEETKKSLHAIFVDICSILHQEPKFICHRDYHSRNIMLKRGKARIIDFQDARMGPIQYDLVSLTHDSYVEINDSSRNEILEDYILKARAHRSTPIQRDHFYSIFNLQTIQRCFKACGSFASFYNMREDTRYLKYLKPTLMRVAKTLEHYPHYALFANILRDHGLLDQDYSNPTEL